MEVKMKIVLNGDEIANAERKNEYYKQVREANEKKPKKERTLVPEDVEVPERDVKIHPRLWDIKDVTEAWINEVYEDMISVIHLGQHKMVIYSNEVWQQLQERFK
jgi:hypothetical protein